MIELINIQKIFSGANGDIHAVDDVSLKVKKGDIYGVIGFSGAGKSTLIRCINLLERPSSGKVIVDGMDMMKLNAKALRASRKKISMIFQHFNLMRSRTVYDNVAFSLKGSGLSKREIKAKVMDLLALVELKDKEHAYPSQLSGGQKQRVAIARALASDPHVLLCDEATSALDPQTTQSILKLLKSLNECLNLTIVLITHEMAVVKSICNQVAIMENGKIVEAGPILSIFSNPQEQVTKNFINTTSSINQVYELIKKQDPLVLLTEDEVLLHFTYSSGSAEEPLMATLVKKFDITFNIIFGNVEVLANSPLGNLVVKLKGKKENIDGAITYAKTQGVRVEVFE